MKRIWHRYWIGFGILSIMALSVLFLGFPYISISAISSGPSLPSNLWKPFLISIGIMVGLYVVIIYPFFRATYFLVKHYQADITLDLETTRKIISQYLTENGIKYSVIDDRRLMPAYTQFGEKRIKVALKFNIEYHPIYVEMMGSDSTTMWLGPIPDPNDSRYMAILDGTSELITDAIERKATKEALGPC